MIIILAIVILIVIGGYKFMGIKKEDREINEDLKKYKEENKKSLKEKLKEGVKDAEDKKIIRVKLMKDGNEIKDEEKTEGAVFALDFNYKGIAKWSLNILTERKKKLLKEINFSDIKEIKIDIGFISQTRGYGIFPAWDYGENGDEIRGKALFTLNIDIETKNAEIEKFSIENLREALKNIEEWAEVHDVEINDTKNIKALLEEKTDGELYRYFKGKNREGSKGGGMDIHYQIYKEKK